MRCATCCGILACFAGIAGAQTMVDGVQFADRGASGEIVLGNLRGGLGVIDFDNDGFMDLAVGDLPGAIPIRLFRNAPDGAGGRTFIDVSAGSGLDDADARIRFGGGVIAGDFDNDGWPDLYMTGYASQDTTAGLLYLNNGDGTFRNVSVAAGVRTIGERNQSCSAVDFDLDGDLDILTANAANAARSFRLWRNNGDATFVDAGGIMPNYSTVSTHYAHAWFDYDGDGDADCFLMPIGVGPVLLRNDTAGDGTRVFTNVATAAGYTYLGPAPMGIAPGDYDNDGDMDFAVSDAAVGTYYRNNGDGTVTRVTPMATIFAWGILWLDADNDGDLDHYQCGSLGRGANFDHLWRNNGGGQFENISQAMNSTFSVSQYSVQVDVDNDGRQEMVTMNPGMPGQFVSVYGNISTTPGNWLKLALAGDGVRVNRSAVGAVVRVSAGGVTQMREIVSGSSTTSTEDLRAHFGLGEAEAVDSIEVVWPRQGNMARRTDVIAGPIAVDQILAISPRCDADYDDDGFVSGGDFDLFVGAFEAGAAGADIDDDGFVAGPDFDAYVAAFEEGCG